MITNKLLVAAVLATALGGTVAGFGEDMTRAAADNSARAPGAVPSWVIHWPSL